MYFPRHTATFDSIFTAARQRPTRVGEILKIAMAMAFTTLSYFNTKETDTYRCQKILISIHS